jgi:hypothetical protein
MEHEHTRRSPAIRVYLTVEMVPLAGYLGLLILPDHRQCRFEPEYALACTLVVTARGSIRLQSDAAEGLDDARGV